MFEILNQHTVERFNQFLEDHFNALERIVEAMQDQGAVEKYARKKTMVPLDGTGAGVAQWQVPLGYDWILQRITTTTSGPGSTAQIFVDTTSPSDLVESIANAQLYSDAFDNDIFVPEGSSLYVVFAAAGANGQATVNLQIKTLREQSDSAVPSRYVEVGDA